jgi:iron(III) transport system substrate-binding protein
MFPRPRRSLPAALTALLALAVARPARAELQELTVYSGRHYESDEKLLRHFSAKTGILVKRVEGQEDELLERLRKEGAASPADVLLATDAARLGEADALGLFAPVASKVLEARIPASLRTPTWFAFATRARVIVYDRTQVKPAEVQTYADLAGPRFKGKLCVRSGLHPYNVSLGASLIAHSGEAAAEAWARGIVANLARPPQGGDTEQIMGVGSGACQVALVNSYYLVRLHRSPREADQKLVKRVALAWPDQRGSGTHVNVSGGGVLKTAPHRDAAVRFLEYLASDEAQSYFATANNEWPVVRSAGVRSPALPGLGAFKPEALDVATLTANAPRARKIFERAGWR